MCYAVSISEQLSDFNEIDCGRRAQLAHFGVEVLGALLEQVNVVGQLHDDFDPGQIDAHLVRQPADLAHPLEVVQRVQANAAL